jgi:hypothetical protein
MTPEPPEIDAGDEGMRPSPICPGHGARPLTERSRDEFDQRHSGKVL